MIAVFLDNDWRRQRAHARLVEHHHHRVRASGSCRSRYADKNAMRRKATKRKYALSYTLWVCVYKIENPLACQNTLGGRVVCRSNSQLNFPINWPLNRGQSQVRLGVPGSYIHAHVTPRFPMNFPRVGIYRLDDAGKGTTKVTRTKTLCRAPFPQSVHTAPQLTTSLDGFADDREGETAPGDETVLALE